MQKKTMKAYLMKHSIQYLHGPLCSKGKGQTNVSENLAAKCTVPAI
jgi:hypothetical protein